jgi:hypothetical protein
MSNILVTILCALLASAGFWGLVTKLVDKKSAKSKMILGLGYNTIRTTAMEYIRRGNITQGEYEDLYKYLYKPYKDMGGNGSAERLMREVDKLPIVPDNHGAMN